MNIAMFTNTFIPHVGGVAHSVKAFTDEYKKLGHRVLVIAPSYPHMPLDEKEVIRVPSIQNFNGSDFSLSLAIPMIISKKLQLFQPDIIHSHHPYLLGDTALRLAASLNVPLVFTYHTMYEQYTHYIPGDSPGLKEFVVELSTGYANLCHHIIAPSRSVAEILKKRGVKKPITIIPTGVEVDKFNKKKESGFRQKRGISSDAFVIGYVGRLAPEKNLEFWTEVVSEFVKQDQRRHVLIAGSGSCEEKIKDFFIKAGLSNRLHLEGVLDSDKLIDVYQAMDVFLFTSKSETQGLVLIEAMAARVPVIGLDAPGVREVVEDHKNGRLLEKERIEDFVLALSWMACLNGEKRSSLKKAALSTAQRFSIYHSVNKALNLYQNILNQNRITINIQGSVISSLIRRIGEEWRIWNNRLTAAGKMVLKLYH